MTPRSGRSALVVCGPTAAGKSEVADGLAEGLSETLGTRVTTILVDSMQVYREIPIITNQGRTRPAEIAGIVSVADEWTVARHREQAEEVIDTLPAEIPFVLDAGTGMYLNAIVLEIPLARKVPPGIRARAEERASGTENPRREVRRQELELAGASERGSIWEGDLRYDADFIYLRPLREDLDRKIQARSSMIVREGLEEAENLLESGVALNPSVREAIGVKEMLLRASGAISDDEAEEAIAARTRRLGRRQMRWFDKLVRNLPDSTRLLVAKNAAEVKRKHAMHDKMAP
jgi:tRNA dimethylallyltransferase